MVADRAAITELMYRFAHGLDRHDPAMVASCFTDDAVFVLEGKPRLVRELQPGSHQDPAVVRESTGLDRIDSSIHAMADVMIDLNGDAAHVETVVLTSLVGPRDGEQTFLFRGIRLHDDVVRVGDEWKIARREHTFVWMFEGTPTRVGPS
jgi:hypothetical protein